MISNVGGEVYDVCSLLADLLDCLFGDALLDGFADVFGDLLFSLWLNLV